MLPRFLALALIPALLLLGLAGCGKGVDHWQGEEGRTRVVVSIAPLASFVQAVGGDRVAVRCLCTQTGPHHYAPDTQDAQVLLRAQLLLTIGLRLDDSFTEAMRSRVQRADLPFRKLGLKLPEESLLPLKHECCKHGEHDPDHHHHHHHGKHDPHVWLGIPEVIEMVKLIRDELATLDPDHKGEYEANADRYVARLTSLHEEGKKLLANRQVKRIVSFHGALEYFARSFGLEIADVIEHGPGDEPSAAHLASLVKLFQNKDKPVGAITLEPQYPKNSSALVLQRELKAKGLNVPLVEVDPLETADAEELAQEGGDWYLTRMRQNLQALARALP